MAYFHCLIGGGSGGGYELTVTCDADFAGTTITCTDGVTTLTQTCPSSSPYEVVFAIPNGGDWTISGVVSGQTVSTGVNIPTSAELIATIQQTVTIHSAKEDTISYTDIDGATQTITFASGATSKQVQITIYPNGSSITFTSSVAKNPNNLSQDYSKTFTIATSTTDIYLMPENALYWYGYESEDFEDMSSANGWVSHSAPFSWVAPTRSTNKINIYCSASNTTCGIASKIKVPASSIKLIYQSVQTGAVSWYYVSTTTKSWNAETSGFAKSIPVNAAVSFDSQTTGESVDCYIGLATTTGQRSTDVFALYYE